MFESDRQATQRRAALYQAKYANAELDAELQELDAALKAVGWADACQTQVWETGPNECQTQAKNYYKYYQKS